MKMVPRYCNLALIAAVANACSTTAAAFQSSPSSAAVVVKSRGKRDETSLFSTINGEPKVSKRRKLRKHSSKQSPRTAPSSDAEDGTKANKEEVVFDITTIEDLNDYFDDAEGRFRKKSGKTDYAALLASLSVKGDTQIIGSAIRKDVTHPVVQLLHERRRGIEQTKQSEQQSANNKHNIHRTIPPEDGFRVALAIEGGGMRGCVTAGMVAAIHCLGLEDTIDVVYGSSAGTVIGAYFITRQLPWFGPELYYDALTTAEGRFINTKRFLRAVGLGLLDPRLTKDVSGYIRVDQVVMNLSYLTIWSIICRSSSVAIMASQY